MILTHNEEANIERTLQGIRWVGTILVVDSYSTDLTLEISKGFPNVRIVQRQFDHFADQCNFGLSQIDTPWVLSMDADYVSTDSLKDEIANLPGDASGYRIGFRYGIYGRVLRASLYPPRVVLYQRQRATYERDGHAHRVKIDGMISDLKSTILHDDRKPISHWIRSQAKYAELEAYKLASTPRAQLGWKDRLRTKYVLAPILTVFYCLFARGLILDGWPGIYYTMQRVFAELTLSMTLLERKWKRG